MRWTLALATVTLAACGVDNSLNGKNDGPPEFDTGTGLPIDTATDTAPPPPDEACNGVDDDGDGEVDEGFPDDNANGRADCLDTTCPALDLGTPGNVTILEECQGTTSGTGDPVDDPWNVRRQWTFTSPSADPSATSAWSQAVIGNLDDDNGDGTIDEDDSPEVVVTVWGSRAWVVAIDGATGAEKWAYDDGNSKAITAIADVTGDGNPDVITNDSSGHTIALDGSGNLEWTATQLATTMGYFMVSTADLDEDGQPEVISDNLVLDGATGNLLWQMRTFGAGCPYLMAAAGDIDDSDRDQEVVYCGVAYDSDGTELWDSGERGSYGMWPVLVQADSDSEAEIGFAGEHWSLWEADGTNIYTVDYPSTQKHPGPPCVGDFDGDGTAEVGFPSYMDFVMYELDGSVLWSAAMNDTSGLAGCSGYDVNGDGPLEVLFADQTTFKIYDGSTGAVLYTDTNHSSGTIFEYPTVADIDHDDHAEIITTNNASANPAVVAYEHAGDGWPAAGTTWAVHDFAITNIEPDGTVPQNPENSWEKYNVYRARVAVDDPSTPDLVVSITDVCVMDCTYGPAAVGLQVTNQGGADVNAGTIVALYAREDAGPRLIAMVPLPAIDAGQRLDGIEVDIAPADVGPWGFIAIVDDDGTGVSEVSECDETNNQDEWNDAFCP
jgi:hypothetical protein